MGIFLTSLLSHAVLYLIFAGLAVGAVILGAKLRKIKDAKDKEKLQMMEEESSSIEK